MSLISKGIAACAMAAMLSFPAVSQTGRSPIACGQPYTISPGDTLSRISARAYGTIAFQALYDHNRAVVGGNPDRIFVGQVLEIPCRGTATVQASATPPTDEATADETVVLTFNRSSAPWFLINKQIVDKYLAQVTEVTEGRVQFVDPAEVNNDPRLQYNIVTSGQVDGAYVLNEHLNASHPLLSLPMLPLMGGSAEQTSVSLWRLHEEYLAQSGYFDDAMLLGFIAAPAAHIWRDAAAPVAADEDIMAKNKYVVPYFEGLDTRGPDATRESVTRWLTDYRAQNDEPPAFFMAHGAARAVGIWTEDVAVTEVDSGVYTATYSVILSNDAWDRISDADQKAILAVSGEALSARSAAWDVFDNGFRADMVSNGLNIVKADAALLDDLAQRTNAGIARWMPTAEAAGIPAQAALDFYRDNLRQLEDRLLFR